MGLLSFLKRNTDPAADAPAAAAPDAVAAARTRARRRLIGAALLLGVGVIGFPLVFETQPRPIPVNIPIEIPRKDGAPPLVLPASVPPLSAASAAVLSGEAEADAAPAGRPAEIAERAGEQGRELPPRPATPAATTRPVAAPATEPDAAAAKPDAARSPEPDRPAPAKSEPAKAEAGKPGDDGARARALLEGRAAAADAAATRMVVQVGAYSEAGRLHDVRQKLEKMGFKTYTQVVQSGGTQQTRVRVGPFANRADAEKAAARIKASGLPVAVLTL